MNDYLQIEFAEIEAKAAELARQFWEEIEAGLAHQRSALGAATTPETCHSGEDIALDISPSKTLLQLADN